MLKRIIPFALVAFTLAACQGKQSETKLSGTAPEEANGSYVYVVDLEKHAAVDSALIENGKFSLVLDAKEPKILQMVCNYGDAPFITEPGTLTTELKMDGSDVIIRGTQLNNDLSEIQQKGTEIQNEFTPILDALVEDTTLTNEEIMARIEEPRQAMFDKFKASFNEYYPKHNNDLVGAYLLLMNYSGILSNQEFDAAMASAGPVVKEHPLIVKIVEEVKSLAKTAIGSMFTDFSGTNPTTSETVSLSDFVGKGNYVIADFWASWCGPCKAEMPTLAKIYKTYHSKGLEIVGVVVSDELDAHKKSVEELNVVWPQIFDAENNGSSAYGVTGIPHIIIFDGEGKIVAKDVRGEGLEKMIAGFYAK